MAPLYEKPPVTLLSPADVTPSVGGVQSSQADAEGVGVSAAPNWVKWFVHITMSGPSVTWHSCMAAAPSPMCAGGDAAVVPAGHSPMAWTVSAAEPAT